ncbi:MAG TPA: hypothetical protein VG759_00400, partial [Candidatus Angelobacter sp.]|nr:hypothetical protein [Candidatus Angelobacter sp.]
MPTEVATPQSAVEQPVAPGPAATANPSNSETSTSPAEVPESSGVETTSAHDESPGEGGEGELRLENFQSMEEMAQALLDRKQRAAPEEQPSAEDAPDDQQRRRPGEVELAQAPEAQTEDEQREQPEPGLDLEGDDVFSPRDLNERINGNPALRQALAADPALRNAMFRNARLAAETSKYKEVFPDVESAQYAAQQASTFREVDDLFLNATNDQGIARFLWKWTEMATVRDEQGNPILERGIPKVHPAFESLLNHMRSSDFEFMRKNAERDGDQELMAALDIVRERSSPASQARDEELPPHIRAAAEQIRARESELNRRQLEQQYAEQARFNHVVGEEVTQKIDALIEPALDKAALSDFVRQTAREKIDSAILENLGRNRFFQARMAELDRYPLTPEARQQRLNLIMSHVQAVAGPVVRQVLREASQPVMRAQEERKAKIDAQVARTRSEPKSTTAASLT